MKHNSLPQPPGSPEFCLAPLWDLVSGPIFLDHSSASNTLKLKTHMNSRTIFLHLFTTKDPNQGSLLVVFCEVPGLPVLTSDCWDLLLFPRDSVYFPFLFQGTLLLVGLIDFLFIPVAEVWLPSGTSPLLSLLVTFCKRVHTGPSYTMAFTANYEREMTVMGQLM